MKLYDSKTTKMNFIVSYHMTVFFYYYKKVIEYISIRCSLVVLLPYFVKKEES